MNNQLENKVALITGGSRGIGLAIAEHFARNGAKLLLVAQNEERLQQAVQRLQKQAVDVAGTACDLSDCEQAKNVLQTCVERFEKIDILVNNAGITRDALAMRMKDEDWSRVLRVNLDSAFYLSRAALRPMMKARKGRIINITSVVGLMGNAGQANYAASKAGLIGLTKSLAKEVGSRGITVNAVAPGFVETDMTAGMKEEIKQSLIQSIPLRRYGKTEEIASAVGFLASDAASYITGQVIVADGGLSM